MELAQLRYFVAVAEEASFTRAAARVHVAQPGVSAQIRQLERELGHDLLDRSGRTVRPTAVGDAVLPYARAALAAVDAVRTAVDELSGLLRGHVAVGMVISCSSLDLPRALAAFHRQHPAVDISLSEANSDALLEALQHGGLDLALVGLATAPPPGIAVQVMADEPLVAAVSRADPLAARSSIALAALQERTLICLPPGTGIRASFDAACARAGLRPRIGLEASDPRVVAQLASQGLGLAILPRASAEAHADELHCLSITRPRLRAQLGLVWRAEGPTNPAARALVDHARGYLAVVAGDRRQPSERRAAEHAAPAEHLAHAGR